MKYGDRHRIVISRWQLNGTLDQEEIWVWDTKECERFEKTIDYGNIKIYNESGHLKKNYRKEFPGRGHAYGRDKNEYR